MQPATQANPVEGSAVYPIGSRVNAALREEGLSVDAASGGEVGVCGDAPPMWLIPH